MHPNIFEDHSHREPQLLNGEGASAWCVGVGRGWQCEWWGRCRKSTSRFGAGTIREMLKDTEEKPGGPEARKGAFTGRAWLRAGAERRPVRPGMMSEATLWLCTHLKIHCFGQEMHCR